MTSATSPSAHAMTRRRTPAHRSRRHLADRAAHGRTRPRCRHVLARYADWRGAARELLAQPGAGGSVLVIDRALATRRDTRLVAHLAPDEPPENAEIASRSYLEHARRGCCRCRPLTPEDLRTVPFADVDAEAGVAAPAAGRSPIVDAHGRCFAIEPLDTGMSIAELRWCRRDGRRRAVLSVRDVVAACESYEPIRTRTAGVVRRCRDDCAVSVATLRAELARVNNSPIVLNRRLREVVVATVERDALSMSEIAIRCGRVKRDAAGHKSGETSWLARRLGLLPEGGHDTPTCWIHTDVLALIARDGLAISPREVEAE